MCIRDSFCTVSQRSEVWKYFIKSTSLKDKAECRLCHQFVCSNGNTSNMHSHIARKHPDIKLEKQNLFKRKKANESCDSESSEGPPKKLCCIDLGENENEKNYHQRAESSTQARVDHMFSDQKSFASIFIISIF